MLDEECGIGIAVLVIILASAGIYVPPALSSGFHQFSRVASSRRTSRFVSKHTELDSQPSWENSSSSQIDYWH